MMIEKFVTNRNIELWEKLSRKFTIEIKPHTLKKYIIFEIIMQLFIIIQ
ncbi:hypothetical protein CHRY9293_03693 [Chryseobacterium potabilaquae]|uniref:Uncharacterized protein n=1 Tax=Chryseobacterium potabilaquae TaxID=2675057 RepID=A0A6N4XF98_9FLAO|nr:hypothetical protein CHRY9293_03693 [Chryseobacterium potabilaquae]